MRHLISKTFNANNSKIFALVVALFASFTVSTGRLNSNQYCKGFTEFTFNTNTNNFPNNTTTMRLDHDPVDLKWGDFRFKLNQSNETSGVHGYSDVCHDLYIGGSKTKVEIGTNPKEVRFNFAIDLQYDVPKRYNMISLTGMYNSSGETKTDLEVFEIIRDALTKNSHEGGFVGDVHNQELHIKIPYSLGSFVLSSGNNLSCDHADGEVIEEDETIHGNCLVDGIAVDKFFVNQASHNVGMWMLVWMIFFFFLVFILFENKTDMSNDNLRDQALTLHPVYSIWNTGSERYTKGSKFTQLYIQVASIYLVSGVLTHKFNEDWTQGELIGAGMGIGIVGGWIMSYFTGFLLMRARNTAKEYYKIRVKSMSLEENKLSREKYERNKYVRYYEYYIFCIIYVFGILICKNFILFYFYC